MREKIMLPADEAKEEYILLKDTPYQSYYGWKAGQRLVRRSIWMSGNGCGVRQALFGPIENPARDGIAWEDHVVPYEGQMDLFQLVSQ